MGFGFICWGGLLGFLVWGFRGFGEGGRPTKIQKHAFEYQAEKSTPNHHHE